MLKSTKIQNLILLAQKRQRFYWPPYKNISDYAHLISECNHVSPYTKCAKNVSSSLFIMLKDWLSTDYFESNSDFSILEKTGRDPKLRTNINLDKLILDHFKRNISEVYATNLFPFIKIGAMTEKIPVKDMIKSALEYAIPQIQIVSPKLVIALGVDCYNALKCANGLKKSKNTSHAIDHPFSIDTYTIWCQAHTSTPGINNRGGINRVKEDWQKMSEWFFKEA